MKKGTLLNSQISSLISTLGHTDEFTICDAGLPIPAHVERIDLALTAGTPSFLDTLRTVLSEAQIEGVIFAQEFKTISPECHQAVLDLLKQEECQTGKSIKVQYLPHETFKDRTKDSIAAIRTGECTPYANVIFQSGVVF